MNGTYELDIICFNCFVLFTIHPDNGFELRRKKIGFDALYNDTHHYQQGRNWWPVACKNCHCFDVGVANEYILNKVLSSKEVK